MSFNGFLNHDGLSYLWSKVVNRISSSETNITAKIPIASDDLPKDLGPSSSGVSSKFSRSDHVHKVPDDIVSYTDAQTGVEETTKINADLLENHPASDFALKTHASQHKVGGSDPILPADINAAPSGYGIGETPKYIANANDAVKNGRYAVNMSTLNLPGPMGELWEYTYLDVYTGNRPDAYIKQTMTSPYQIWHQCAVTRCFYDPRGGWQPWEWVNPPMALNTEYRTTERYMGRSVYKKLVALGEAPSAKGTKEIFPFGKDYNAGTYNVFSVDAHLSNSENDGGWTITMPYFNINGEFITDIRFSGTRIDFYSTGQAGYYGFALLKYIKNTD